MDKMTLPFPLSNKNISEYLRKSNLAHIFARNNLRIMAQTRDIFQAIADPTRRQIIGMLAGQSLNVNAIAKEFDITRQAVSLHIQFLNDCGLIIIKQQGRERYCEAKLEKLNEVTAWVDQYRKYWDKKLDSLEGYLAKIQKKKK
ncbi:ArsR/SmtB family transcription factor [Chitinophaga sp. SYP-B3965]|uniref:ArsR/SmtB family transcription factor n=1 Tax=Chitinophaga sp. SYP-B3965 TaxID=2663120 RepID=UPI00352CAFD7